MIDLLLIHYDYGSWRHYLVDPDTLNAQLGQAYANGTIKRFVSSDVLTSNVQSDPLAQNGAQPGDALLLRCTVRPMREVTTTQVVTIGWEVDPTGDEER